MLKAMKTEEIKVLKRRIRACWRKLPSSDTRLEFLWDAAKAELLRRETEERNRT